MVTSSGQNGEDPKIQAVTQYVVVSDSADGEPIELPTNPDDNTLGLMTLQHTFPGAHGLKYTNSATGTTRALRIDPSGTKFFEPEGGWSGKVFLATYKPASLPITSVVPEPRQLTPMEVKNDKGASKVMTDWRRRVLKFAGRKMTGTCVLINKRHILTAAHLSFKLDETYPIQGETDHGLVAKCVFICNQFDFALLLSDLEDMDFYAENLNKGDTYFTMGYPQGSDHAEPNISKGFIEGRMPDHIQLIGSPGSTHGYSGAPVFTDRGYLAGILLGESSETQKYSRILPISAIVASHTTGNSDSES